MLTSEEETNIAEQFGVARSQVRRDHLISHLLAALSTYAAAQGRRNRSAIVCLS